MQIAPTGGAAGTGVSEAKLTPSGQSRPAAGAGGSPTLNSSIPAALAGDTALVRQLAATDLLKLTQILQPAPPPARVALFDNLVRETVRAMDEGRIEWAVGRLIEAATTDPTRVDELRSKPELQSIQANVDHLLARLTNVAKMDAEAKLSSVERFFENAGWEKLPHWETSTQSLIQIAHRLIEAGGYANYVRTTELTAALQSAYWGGTVVEQPLPPPPMVTPTEKPERTTVTRRRRTKKEIALEVLGHLREELPRRVTAMWERAPLLILLASWFTVGFAAGVVAFVAQSIWPDSWVVEASRFGFKVWALGLLALVGFGFWARVRQRRR